MDWSGSKRSPGPRGYIRLGRSQPYSRGFLEPNTFGRRIREMIQTLPNQKEDIELFSRWNIEKQIT